MDPSTGHPFAHLCPKFQTAMEVLARPWTGLIVATLEPGALRFSEIGERIATLGDRMLSLRLKELEALGVVVRRVVPGPPVRVEYELSDAGRGFGPVAAAIGAWGAKLESAQRAAGLSPPVRRRRRDRPADPTREPPPRRAPAGASRT